MTDLLLIFFGACLVNNLVLDHLLAVDPALAMADRIEAAVDLGLAMILFAPPAAVLGHVFSVQVLAPLGLEYLQLTGSVLIIAAGVTLTAALMKRLQPGLYDRVGDMIPLILLNCTLLGIVLLDLLQGRGIIAAFVFGLGAGTGVFLVVVALSAMQEKLAGADIPLPFQGVAIHLIALGLLSMAFMGFSGLGPL